MTGTHFTDPQRVGGWVDLRTAVSLTVLQQCNIVNLYMLENSCVCGVMHQSKCMICEYLIVSDSLSVHIKNISNMAAWFHAEFSDVASPTDFYRLHRLFYIDWCAWQRISQCKTSLMRSVRWRRANRNVFSKRLKAASVTFGLRLTCRPVTWRVAIVAVPAVEWLRDVTWWKNASALDSRVPGHVYSLASAPCHWRPWSKWTREIDTSPPGKTHNFEGEKSAILLKPLIFFLSLSPSSSIATVCHRRHSLAVNSE